MQVLVGALQFCGQRSGLCVATIRFLRLNAVLE